MQQKILRNCKVIGVEKVSYENYMGNMVSGARVSFAAALPETETTSGVMVHYQWINEEKLPKDLAVGKYYDLSFNVDQQKGNKYFDKLLRPQELVEFTFSC